jgi:hypothetical protein
VSVDSALKHVSNPPGRRPFDCWAFNLVCDSAGGVGVAEEEADSILGAPLN